MNWTSREALFHHSRLLLGYLFRASRKPVWNDEKRRWNTQCSGRLATVEGIPWPSFAQIPLCWHSPPTGYRIDLAMGRFLVLDSWPSGKMKKPPADGKESFFIESRTIQKWGQIIGSSARHASLQTLFNVPRLPSLLHLLWNRHVLLVQNPGTTLGWKPFPPAFFHVQHSCHSYSPGLG